MILLKVKCDNLYMFKDFEIDFTYERKIKHPLSQDDVLFKGSKINVRKNLIIMGGNAAGKTTFGKLLCLISNYIVRGYVDKNYFGLDDIRYDRERNSSFYVEFYLDGYVYSVDAAFENTNLKYESVKMCKVYETYNIKKLRRKLLDSTLISQYISMGGNNENKELLFSSCFSSNENEVIRYIKSNIQFMFRMSSMNNDSTAKPTETDIKMLDEILPLIDDSVKSVSVMSANGKDTSTYQITFNNGSALVVPDGDLSRCKDRLSHGTFEAIDFLITMYAASKDRKLLAYVDERLAHMHSELEAYLARKMFLCRSYDSQFFFTTHNLEMFQLNIPMNAFLFFKRNENGFNEAMYPSDVINKNDRSLSSYYANDYFGVLPNYSVMDNFFDKLVSKKEE